MPAVEENEGEVPSRGAEAVPAGWRGRRGRLTAVGAAAGEAEAVPAGWRGRVLSTVVSSKAAEAGLADWGGLTGPGASVARMCGVVSELSPG